MKKYIFLFSLLLFSGCGLWGDFTTYFNLYYNAKDLFSLAETEIYSQKRPIFSTIDLIVPGTSATNINKVIEKCSKILQYSSETVYIDEALLMIGKCFYYQRNYLKSQRKFQELIATQPESDLIPEAELWIAKTQMRLKDYENGLASLQSVRDKALEEGEDDLFLNSFIEETVYRITKEEFPAAISLSESFILNSDDDEINAEVVYELGKLYNKVNDNSNAIASFSKVFDFSPSFDIEMEAKIELAKALGKENRNEEALEILEDMRTEDKYSTSYDLIDLETGLSLVKLNRIEEAISKLRDVDTLYVNSTSSGAAKYELGKIMEEKIHNLDSAYFYYNRAASTSLPEEYVLPAREKKQVFTKYINLNKQLNDYSEQLFYASNLELYRSDSLAYVEDSLRAFEEWKIQNIFKNASYVPIDSVALRKAPIDTSKIKDSLQIVIDSLMFVDTTGFKRDSLFKSLKFSYDTLLIDKTILHLEENKSFNTLSLNPDSLNISIPKPRRPLFTADSLNKLIVKNKLEEGNLFFTELNMPDSAYKNYIDILTNYPENQYTANTMYGLATYYLTVDKQNEADSLFNLIYDNYKTQSIVNAAALKLNKPPIDLDFDPADQVYSSAEADMLNNQFDSAVNKYFNLFVNYPNSSLAPKALYAGGYILENSLDNSDSAVVFYDSLLVKYPTSVYAIKIRPKINFYKLELQKRKKAELDSLKREQSKKDSLSLTVKETEIKTNPNNITGTDSTLMMQELSNNDSLKTKDQQIENIDSTENSFLRNQMEEMIKQRRGTIPPGKQNSGDFKK